MDPEPHAEGLPIAGEAGEELGEGDNSQGSEPPSPPGSVGSGGSWTHYGPPSLLRLAEQEVLCGIEQASQSLGAAFSVGGTLGRLPVALALQAATGSSTSSGGELVAVCFPDGGQQALAALQAACTPASFGKGKETVLDESYRRALALPAARIFPQFDLGQHSSVLQGVQRVLLPGAELPTASLHALNVYTPEGLFRPHRDTPRGDPGFVGSLVVCLPVGHAGGGLRVSHRGQSVVYEWGEGAAEGEVQWAAFFSDCLHEVLPVTDGARVTLAYELFSRPAEPGRSLPADAGPLLQALRSALDSSSFMVNGGRLGFPCAHTYPNSLVEGISEEGMRPLLKGEDAALVLVLEALHVPYKVVRAWKDEGLYENVWGMEEGFENELEYEAFLKAPMVGRILPGHLAAGGEDDYSQEGEVSWLEDVMEARKDTSIAWLGGQEAFSEWVVGARYKFYYGNHPVEESEFYCSVAIVAEVPPYADRQEVGRMRWAGGTGAAASGAGASGSAVRHSPTAWPDHKRAKHSGGG